MRLYGRNLDRVGRDLSLVYGLDTLGAALGALTAGFLLVPKAGLSASTWILGLAAAGLGLVILVSQRERAPVGRKGRKARRGADTETEPAAEPAPADRPPARLGVLLATFFLTGGAALLLETGWNRFFSLLNGTHVYSTSTVLAGFLSGIGLGSLVMAKRIDRIRDPFAAAAWLFAAIALCEAQRQDGREHVHL